ncbi:MAG TPA: hypothetical protein VM121_10715 [Acidimicrobiales bacterium]|nr:hypothetical protein [Acidimicrobiales bacterium]
MRSVKGLGVAISAAIVVACGSSTGAGGRPAVLDAYRQSWTDLIAAGDPIKPDAPELRIHRSGQALDVIVAVLRDYEAKGVVYRGSVDLHPNIVEFNGDKAEIRDCVFDHTETLDPMTNKIVKAAADHPRWVNTTMQVVDGAWKAVNFAPEDQECTPEP